MSSACLLLPVVLFVVTGITQPACAVEQEQNDNETPTTGLGFLKEEDVLFHKLLNSAYNKYTRPVYHPDDIITVRLWMYVLNIVEVDMKLETFKATIFFKMSWLDGRLAWNETDHPAVKLMYLPTDRIWLPSLGIKNKVDAPVPLEDLPVKVTSDGEVNWSPAYLVTTHCTMDFSHSKIHDQECTLQVWPKVHDTNQYKFELHRNVTDKIVPFRKNSLWDVVDSNVTLGSQTHCCPVHAHEIISFRLWLTRSVPFYNKVQVLPASILIFLVPLMFLLPRNTNQKLSFGGILLLTHAVLLLVVENGLPSQHYQTVVPAVYILASMVVVVVALFLLVVLQRIYEEVSPKRRLPSFIVRMLNGCIGRCLCVLPIDVYNHPVPFTETMSDNISKQDDTDDITESRKQSWKRGDYQLLVQVLERIFFIVFLAIALISSLDLVPCYD